jgi:hypothetical protein
MPFSEELILQFSKLTGGKHLALSILPVSLLGSEFESS